ncbi:potassium transporter TrkG [Kordiimonas sp.]|uniref:potassium transporter TrkG n=1 Tax=Kordiimonas sp. TaxID=1970157 RepID=UPI003A8E1E15
MWVGRLFFLIGCWILILGLLQFVPFFTALFLGEAEIASSFFVSISIVMLVGGSLYLGFRSSVRVRVRKLTILLPLVGGICLAFAAGLPFFFLFPSEGLIAAFFEGMSLVTTTGASAYEGNVEDMKALQLWRLLASWLGGFMSVCITLSLLTALNSGGLQLHHSPLPYGDSDKGYPRLRSTAETLLPIYVFYTAMCCLLLMLGGESFGDAAMLAMASISTTGITPTSGHVIAGSWVQFIVTLFSLIAILNWDMQYARLKQLRLRGTFGQETRVLMLVAAFAVIILFFLSAESHWSHLWYSVFSAVSALATTGFQAAGGANIDDSLPASIIIILLTCLGGAVAGTSGGLKQLRASVIYMLGRSEVDRLAHPHGVRTLRYDGEVIQAKDVEAVWLLVGGFVLIFTMGALVLAILGIGFREAIALSLSSLTLSGPLAAVIDPYFPGFSGLQGADYIVLSILMLVGRVEASLFLALFARSMWRG